MSDDNAAGGVDGGGRGYRINFSGTVEPFDKPPVPPPSPDPPLSPTLVETLKAFLKARKQRQPPLESGSAHAADSNKRCADGELVGEERQRKSTRTVTSADSFANAETGQNAEVVREGDSVNASETVTDGHNSNDAALDTTEVIELDNATDITDIYGAPSEHETPPDNANGKPTPITINDDNVDNESIDGFSTATMQVQNTASCQCPADSVERLAQLQVKHSELRNQFELLAQRLGEVESSVAALQIKPAGEKADMLFTFRSSDPKGNMFAQWGDAQK